MIGSISHGLYVLLSLATITKLLAAFDTGQLLAAL